MKKKILFAFKWDFLGSIFRQVLGLSIAILLARLLSPEEFGVVAIAIAIIYVLKLVSNFGLSQAIIQSYVKDQITLSSVFFVNVLIGGIVSSILFFLSSSISDFYDIPSLKNVIRYLSITIILQSFSSVQVALLSQDLDFKSLNMRIIISQIIGAFIGILFALYGYGIYALIWQNITVSLIDVLLLWNLSSWRPSLEFKWNLLKPLLSFSFYLFSGQVLDNLIKGLDELIIGKCFSVSLLGYFGRANSLFNSLVVLSSGSIKSVFFPVLSNLKDSKTDFDKIYFLMIFLITTITCFLSGIMILSSEAIILILFGENWRGSINIFQILSLKLFTYPLGGFLVTAFLSKGYAKENFYFGIFRKILRLGIYFFAFNYGFYSFLLASVIVNYIAIFYNSVINSHYLKLSLIKQLKQVIFPMFVCLLCLATAKLIFDNILNIFLESLLSSLLFGVLYITLFYIFRKKDILKMINIILDAKKFRET